MPTGLAVAATVHREFQLELLRKGDRQGNVVSTQAAGDQSRLLFCDGLWGVQLAAHAVPVTCKDARVEWQAVSGAGFDHTVAPLRSVGVSFGHSACVSAASWRCEH